MLRRFTAEGFRYLGRVNLTQLGLEAARGPWAPGGSVWGPRPGPRPNKEAGEVPAAQRRSGSPRPEGVAASPGPGLGGVLTQGPQAVLTGPQSVVSGLYSGFYGSSGFYSGNQPSTPAQGGGGGGVPNSERVSSNGAVLGQGTRGPQEVTILRATSDGDVYRQT